MNPKAIGTMWTLTMLLAGAIALGLPGLIIAVLVLTVIYGIYAII